MCISFSFQSTFARLNYSTHFTDQKTWLRWTKGHTKVTVLISDSTRIKIWLSYLLWASFEGGKWDITFCTRFIYQFLRFPHAEKKVPSYKLCFGAAVRNQCLGRVYYRYTLFHITYGYTELKDILWQKDLKSSFNRI